MKTAITLATIILGATLLVTLTTTKDAGAVNLYHASQCSAYQVAPGSGGTGGPVPMTLTNVDGSQLTNKNLSDGAIICPVVRVQGANNDALVTIDVWKNASDGIVVKGCHTWTTGGGGTCTASNPNTGTGIQHITVPEAAWDTSSYNYIFVTIKQNINGDYNTFFGYHHNN